MVLSLRRTALHGAALVLALGGLLLVLTIGFWGLSCALAALCFGLLPSGCRGPGLPGWRPSSPRCCC